ncbi:MAG: glutamine synthetase III [Oligoflexia bacterium]|nr:glutamine synthetase III [Oligoflexia bacterium]
MTIGTGARARFEAIRDVNTRTPRKFDPPRDEHGKRLRVSEFYGQNTFDLNKMKEKLPKDVYTKILSTIETGKKLDQDIANSVANAIKEWALSRGVTHFCHWFQPQTGTTAEKHDAFLSYDDNGRTIEKFSGAQLIQSEPDASSFPSGGMRTTFEARGYTAWDPTSPVFIVEHTNGKTLCIPSVFISYHGDALDEKTALMRSMEVVSQKSCELLHLLGETGVKRILPTLGAEQEYFLIDRAFASLRPDLVMTGRTLIGGQPPKGQQLEDHYFGSVPARVQAFMSEVEYELYKLGVPVKTRHNEVAPSQFETAPIFEEANIATDHNQLTMEILRRVALRHNFSVLLHEKPFAGINGSGKHNNWSLAVTASGPDHDGENLLEPGKSPHKNLRFLLVLTAILKGVHKHAGILRASIASAGNDHRLGANEAPPAIISVFLGEQLSRILDAIESGTVSNMSAEQAVIKLGVGKLPEVSRDNTDRNRTSPFAFTGNKFEFRAVGSSASTAFPVTLVNAAVADGFSEITEALRAKFKTAKSKEAAIFEVLVDAIKETRNVRFEGNGYSEEWVKEAAKRGLPNLRKTPEALAELVSEKSKQTLTKLGIFSEAELVSRYHVRVERYVKNLLIEAESLRAMVDTQVLPACLGYHANLAQGAVAAKAAGLTTPSLETANKLSTLLGNLQAKRAAFEKAFHKVEGLAQEDEKALSLCNEVAPLMAETRAVCDELEAIVADDYWPLPKYREMLFLA